MLANPLELLLQAKQGSDVARGELLESYRAYLELLARVELGRRLQTKVDAADLVQETFLEAHRNFALFRGQSEPEFAAWLREILSGRICNLVRHYLGTQGRDLRRERAWNVNLDESSRAIDRGFLALQSTPSQHVAAREQGVLLAQALSRLPPDYREVVVLRHFEELTFPEVARRMDRTVDSVQKLWVRALASLKQTLPEVV
ncbi:MAG TPA: sigma-70 family RNA polymerase sigma factor [Pirellulales bacterium]|nr:sigma-70 family RNA polymerase sigma factor [Pirellulales bacterium]